MPDPTKTTPDGLLDVRCAGCTTPEDCGAEGVCRALPPDRDLQPAAHIDMVALWRFTLSRADALLVLKALGGRLSAQDIEPARQLGNRLTMRRATIAHQHADALEHAARRAAEGGGR